VNMESVLFAANCFVMKILGVVANVWDIYRSVPRMSFSFYV
jgi:hypothetical protein